VKNPLADQEQTPCLAGQPTATPAETTPVMIPTSISLSASPSQPLVTTAPTLAPRVAEAEPEVDHIANIAKRDAPLPPYMSDLAYFWSSIYLAPACSCLITSAKPATLSTTTLTRTVWTSSTVSENIFELKQETRMSM
jgi:hypothetical protein